MTPIERDPKVLGYLKLLTAIVFISMAIITAATVISFRSAQEASENSKTNSRTLALVEQCVLRGECGPQQGGADAGTIKIVNYMVDSIGCILLIDPPARTADDIQRCKLEAAPK